MGISDLDDFNFFMSGMCLISFGGSGVQNAIIHLSNLFPEYKGTMTAIITGSFQLSFVIFYLFNLAWEGMGWTCSQLFQTYAILSCGSVILSVLVWPDSALNYDEQMALLCSADSAGLDLGHTGEASNRESKGRYRLPSKMVELAAAQRGSSYDSLQTASDRRSVEAFFAKSPPKSMQNVEYSGKVGSTRASPPRAVDILANEMAHLTHTERWCMESGCIASGDQLDPMVQSLGEQMTSLAFIRLAVLFTFCSFWANFYIGTAVTQLADLDILPQDQISKYGSYLTLSMTAGVLFIPLSGWLMDVYGYPTTMLVTILSSIVWAFFLCLQNADFLIPSFVAYAFFRTLLYTFIFSYMADRLGFQFFGILVGVLFIISGFMGLLQYPFSEWAYGNCYSTNGASNCSSGQWSILNHFMFANFVLLLFFPFQDHVERRELQRRSSSQMYTISKFPDFVE